MILLTGGKTGGHITPLINIYKKLNFSFFYIGQKESLEESLCKRNNLNFLPLLKYNNNFFYMIKESKKLCCFDKYKIDAIISTGGFVSLPTLYYGFKRKIPIYLIEENSCMGYSNFLFSFISKRIYTAFPTVKTNKTEYIGMPLIENKKQAKIIYDILIIGGSLGSLPLINIAYQINDKYKILLISGNYYSKVKYKSNITNIKYSDKLINEILKSKIIISRAGAMTTYEIMSINKPLILIPSLKTRRNHQIKNAEFLSEKGLCIYINQHNIAKINTTIDYIINNRELINSMMIKQKEYIKFDAIEKIREDIENEI